MSPTLERLIRLQAIDNAVDDAGRQLADLPARLAAVDAAVLAAEHAVAAAREALAGNQAVRRQLEKDLAVVQGRLSRYKDQLMEVKTNKEYSAMQSEIAVAEREVREFEDRLLELMLEADERSTGVKQADEALVERRRHADEARAAIDRDRIDLNRRIEETAGARTRLVAEIEAPAIALFEHVARGRKGLAVVEARDGHCSVCQMRLRPQVFNEIRRNDTLIQCESCSRILYYSPTPIAPTA